MIFKKKISLFIFFTLLSFLFFFFASQAKASQVDTPTIIKTGSRVNIEIKLITPPLPAPTLISPTEKEAIGKSRPFITGLSVNQSFIHVYIDGVYNGRTPVLAHESGTANFAYEPFLNLSVGRHRVWAVAEDEGGEKSKISNVLEFRIEEPMPAPTLFAPVVNNNTDYSHPFIVGLAKNDSFIKVYINRRLAGQFTVENHESGTANFAFKSPYTLTRGSHLVYTTATDKRGKESQWSNIVYFIVRQPIIAQSAQEEKEGAVGKIEESVSAGTEDSSLLISPSGDVERAGKIEEDISDEGIRGIIGQIEKKEETESGLIDEAKKEQSKLGLNLIIFVAFLLGIIGWIFWVNKELIKERREQEEKGKDVFENSTSKPEKENDIFSDNSREKGDKLF